MTSLPEPEATSENASDETVFTGTLIALPVVTLILFDLVVVVGNSLVMVAVHTLPRLKATVNIFIVSLAASDLAIGLLVLPFSSAYEVLSYWPFGSLTCSVWLAVDVWLCTASILNLCAISLDRYLAVSRPFRYPELMSTKRSKMLVCSVWCLAFLVCLPPLVGWRSESLSSSSSSQQPQEMLHQSLLDANESAAASFASNYTTTHQYQYVNILPNSASLSASYDNGHGVNSNTTSPLLGNVTSQPETLAQCLLTSERGYVVYSALTSFWLPASVMLAFYWQIYRVAALSSAALRRGEIRTSTADLTVPDSPNTAMTLRVHRGTSSPNACVIDVNGKRYSALPNGDRSPCGGGKLTFAPRKQSSLDSALAPPRSDDGRRRGSAMSEQVTSRPSRERELSGGREEDHDRDRDRPPLATPECSSDAMIKIPSSGNVSTVARNRSDTIDSLDDAASTSQRGGSSSVADLRRLRAARRRQRLGSPGGPGGGEGGGGGGGCVAFSSELLGNDDDDDDYCDKDKAAWADHNQQQIYHQQQQQPTAHQHRKGTMFQLKAQAKRFKKEQKAAKTVGVIVGCFVLCWAPFFTVYLLGAFCDNCTPQVAFRVFFWLGYCNSAINPFVYALFSRDYRTAFRKLLSCQYGHRRTSFDHQPSRSSRLLSSLLSSVRFRGASSHDIDDDS